MTLRSTIFSLGAAVLVAVLGGCESDGTGLDAGMLETADALQVVHYDDVLFLSRTEPANTHMDALFEGQVTRDDDGCIRLETEAGFGLTAVWPYGFSMELDGGVIRILDASGEAVGAVGEVFRMGGGEVDELHDGLGFTVADQELANARCPGKFWVVADVL